MCLTQYNNPPPAALSATMREAAERQERLAQRRAVRQRALINRHARLSVALFAELKEQFVGFAPSRDTLFAALWDELRALGKLPSSCHKSV